MLELPIAAGIGAGPIRLGASRDDARQLLENLGFPLGHAHGSLDYFCGDALQLEYENDLVRFIGISEHPDISCTYGDQDVFDTDAETLFQLFASNEKEAPTVSPGETHFFPGQGLNLWEADEQYDRRGGFKRTMYAQVGVEPPSDR